MFEQDRAYPELFINILNFTLKLAAYNRKVIFCNEVDVLI